MQVVLVPMQGGTLLIIQDDTCKQVSSRQQGMHYDDGSAVPVLMSRRLQISIVLPRLGVTLSLFSKESFERVPRS